MKRRRVLILVVAGLAVSLAAWLVVRALEVSRFQAEMRRAQNDFRSRRFGAARARLARLAKHWPGRGEVAYWLGSCEMAIGRTEAALEAWGRVPDQAPEAPLAALSRGRLALDCGRYGLAEKCLDRASRGGGDVGDEARLLLARVHWITGRHDEYRDFLRRKVERTRDPSETLRLLWSLDHEPYPIEGMRQMLEKTKVTAQDDDRVWLALADLATRSGRWDEARAWLERCERARPDDRAVWRAWLEWSQAAGEPGEAMRAASRLPASALPAGRLLSLVAWLAARRGDRRAEREALEKLIALEPEETASLERLADLAAQDGQMDRHAELRRKKAVIDAARSRYGALMSQPEPALHAAELARAAERLGRRFDARTWWELVARRDLSTQVEAEGALARLAKAGPAEAPAPSGRSVGDLLGPQTSQGNETTALPGYRSVPAFVDEAERRGLTFTFTNGRSDLRQLPETGSGVVALLDFDGDGWLDVYAVQGGPFPPPEGIHPPFGDRLFRNRGDGRFDDATASAGLATLWGGYGYGVAVGDYDNDGRPDLFITRWRSYALYHNLGQGKFEDVTARAGLGGGRDWPTSAAWADLDNDGDLDLYVCHYLQWDPATSAPCHRLNRPEYTYCMPRLFPALPDHVFRNDGGRFVDVTALAGIVDHDGRGLGVVAADLDDDGKTDLFVANDTSANFFFRNQGGFRFVEQGEQSGLATSASGGYLAGMGVACGDFDGDGRVDLAVTNFFGESTTLYHNHGGGLFSDRAAAAGIATATHFVLGFGLAALDANNDGRLDLAQANGHVDDYRPTIPYEMPAQLFLGDCAGRLIDVSDRAGPPGRLPRLARGLAVGDVDNDGRIDLLLVSENAPLSLFHNQAASRQENRSASQDHFLTLGLEGTASNRDAVGARVAVTVSGQIQVAMRFGGGSYLSASDPRLHFGLGKALVADRVEVRWPSGRRQAYQSLAADGGYRLIEGDPVPRPLAGFSPVTIKR